MAGERDRISEILDAWSIRYPKMNTEGISIVNRILVISQILNHACNTMLNRFELSVADFDILATLLRQQNSTISCSQLSKCTMLTNGAITKRIDSLIARGYVARKEDTDDRRSVLNCLTENGKRTVESALKYRAEKCCSLLSGLTVPERRLITTALTKLLNALENPRKVFPNAASAVQKGKKHANR